MKQLFLMLIPMIALAAIAFAHRDGVISYFRNRGLQLALNASIDCEGPTLTRMADAAHTDYILVKRGSTAATGYNVCGANDQPFAVALDSVSSTQTGEARALRALGLGDKAIPIRVSEASTIGEIAVTAASGRVQSGMPATAGTYYIVGRHSKAQSTAGELGEIIPCSPQKLVVVANGASLATTQAAMVDGAIVNVLAS